MENAAFQAMIDRYKAEMLRTAARSALPAEELAHTNTSGTPAAEGTVPVETSGSIRPAEDTATPAGVEPAPVQEEPEINPPEAPEEQDPLQTIKPKPDTYESFLQKNPQSGILRIQAFAGQQAVPVVGAQVTVSREFQDGSREFATGVTDENGVLDGIVLPAPDKSLSESPTVEAPYATYDIRVSHPGYRTEIYQKVPVFDGIKSIQPVRFLSNRSEG